MLAAVLVSVNDHDATTSASIVPTLATPAAVPAPVAAFIWAICQRALGQGSLVIAWRRRVRNVLLSHISAGFAFGWIFFRGCRRLGAIFDLSLDMLAGQLESYGVAHDVFL